MSNEYAPGEQPESSGDFPELDDPFGPGPSQLGVMVRFAVFKELLPRMTDQGLTLIGAAKKAVEIAAILTEDEE